MSKKVVFIADFFADQVLGGGELNNEELIQLLRKAGTSVICVNSPNVTLDFLKIHKKDFFIIANFIGLSDASKTWLTNSASYIIYEHDHKYIASRNPAMYKDFKAPATSLRNFTFYKNAKKIICQSNFHKDIVEKNLGLSNIFSVGGNLWSSESLAKLREISKKPKKDQCSIMSSTIPHKNTQKAIQYCTAQNKPYELVADSNYFAFLQKLGNNKTLVFFPGTPETLSRVVCEARMMGMSVCTNDLVGAAKEPWFVKKGEDLISHMEKKKEEITDLIFESMAQPNHRIHYPKISIISTFHDGSEFLRGFLNNITQQSIFDECELILVDANSQGSEIKLIQEYQKSFSNIKYIRLEQSLKPTPCLNMAIKNCDADYVTFGFIDDRKSKTCIEELYTEIVNSSEIDLVYGEVALSSVPNEEFTENPQIEKFEHSQLPFSRENMVKCLPGPMPMWRKMVHDKCGFFDEEDCDFADDWDMWLRMVHAGSTFKKLHKTVGLYLVGGRSQQDGNVSQRREEAKIFFKYSHIFGYNFNKYSAYFQQFL